MHENNGKSKEPALQGAEFDPGKNKFPNFKVIKKKT
jgi:hypothetical protein